MYFCSVISTSMFPLCPTPGTSLLPSQAVVRLLTIHKDFSPLFILLLSQKCQKGNLFCSLTKTPNEWHCYGFTDLQVSYLICVYYWHVKLVDSIVQMIRSEIFLSMNACGSGCIPLFGSLLYQNNVSHSQTSAKQQNQLSVDLYQPPFCVMGGDWLLQVTGTLILIRKFLIYNTILDFSAFYTFWPSLWFLITIMQLSDWHWPVSVVWLFGY